MVYCSDDPLMAKRLEDSGAVAIMPLAAPIGSGLGIHNKLNISLIIKQSKVPMRHLKRPRTGNLKIRKMNFRQPDRP